MPLFDQAYNFTDYHICNIDAYPNGCLSGKNELTCTRGSNAKNMKIIRFAFVFAANICIIVSVIILVLCVVRKERRMATNHTKNARILTHSTKKTWQGIWYVAAFMIVWVPWYIWQFIRITTDMEVRDADSASLIYILAVTSPTQG